MKITLEELRAWVAVVDTGSITAAADQLSQTSSGISRALSRLEQKLQTTLLHRTTRRLALTEEGQIFLDHARQILASVENAEEQIALRRETPAGRLRVNAATPFMLHVIAPLVGEFSARYPQIQLELNTDEVLIDLLEQQTDIAIRIGDLRDSSIHARPLGTSKLHLVASPDYLAKHGRPGSVKDLASHRLIGFSYPDKHNRWPVRGDDEQFMQIKPDIASSNGEVIRHLALCGQGIARMSGFLTRVDVAAGRLELVLDQETHEMKHVINAVYYRNTTLSARITCFLDFLSEQIVTKKLL